MLRKTPVDSTTYLAPASPQGISAGFMLECETNRVVREEMIPDVQNINMGDSVGQRYRTISPQNLKKKKRRRKRKMRNVCGG